MVGGLATPRLLEIVTILAHGGNKEDSVQVAKHEFASAGALRSG